MFKALARAGAQTVKYQIALEPVELTYDKKVQLPGPVVLVWEKSPRTAKSTPVTGVNGSCSWPLGTPAMQLVSTMYKKGNNFQKKESSLKARVIVGKDEKTLGKTDLDLATLVRDDEYTGDATIKLGSLQLKCRVHSRPLPQGVLDDSASMASGMSGGIGGSLIDDTELRVSTLMAPNAIANNPAIAGAGAGAGAAPGPTEDAKQTDIANLADLEGFDELRSQEEPPAATDAKGETLDGKEDATSKDETKVPQPEEVTKLEGADAVVTAPTIVVKDVLTPQRDRGASASFFTSSSDNETIRRLRSELEAKNEQIRALTHAHAQLQDKHSAAETKYMAQIHKLTQQLSSKAASDAATEQIIEDLRMQALDRDNAHEAELAGMRRAHAAELSAAAQREQKIAKQNAQLASDLENERKLKAQAEKSAAEWKGEAEKLQQLLRSAEQKLEQGAARAASLESNLQSTTEALEAERARVVTHLNEIEELQRQLAAVKNQAETLNKLESENEAALAKLQSKCSGLESENSALKHELETVRASLTAENETLRSDIKQLEDEYDRSKQQLLKYADAARAIELERDAARQRIAELQQQHSTETQNFKTKISQLQDELSGASNKIVELERAAKDAREDANELRETLRRENASWEATKFELDQVFTKCKAELDAANSQLKMRDRELQQAQEDIVALQKEKDSLTEEMNQASAQSAQALKAAQASMEAMRAEAGRLEAALSAAQAELQSKVALISQLQSQLQQTQSDAQTESNNTITTLLTRVTELESKLEALRQIEQEQGKALSHAQSELAVKASELEALTSQLESAKHSADAFKQALEDEKRKLTTAQRAIERLEAEMKEQAASKQAAEATAASYEKELGSTRASLKDAQNTIAQFEKDLARLERDLATSRANYERAMASGSAGLSDAVAQAEDQRLRAENLESKLAEERARAEALAERERKLSSRLEAMLEHFKKSESELASYEVAAEKARTEINALETKLRETEAVLEHTKQEKLSHQAQIQALQNALSTEKVTTSSLLAQVDSLREMLSKRESIFVEKPSPVKGEQPLQVQPSDVIVASADTSASADSAKVSSVVGTDSSPAKPTASEDAEGGFAALTAEREELLSQLVEARTQALEAGREVRELTAKLHALEKSYNDLQVEASESAAQIAVLEGRVRERTLLTSEWEVKHARAAAQLQQHEAHMAETMKLVESLQAEVTSLRSQLTSLQAANTRAAASNATTEVVLRERLEIAEQERDRALKNYDKMAAKTGALREENAELRAELTKTEEIAARAGKQLEILQNRLDAKEREFKAFVDSAADFARLNTSEIQRLTTENKQLRERHVTFDRLLESALAGKGPNATIEELVKRIEFYESQLEDADRLLIQTKETWQATAEILRERINGLEEEVKELKSQLQLQSEARGMGELEYDRLRQQLNKSERRCEKLSELMSKFEIELIQRKVELANSEAQRKELEKQVSQLKAQLADSMDQWLNAQSEAKEAKLEIAAKNRADSTAGKRASSNNSPNRRRAASRPPTISQAAQGVRANGEHVPAHLPPLAPDAALDEDAAYLSDRDPTVPASQASPTGNQEYEEEDDYESEDESDVDD